MLYRQSTFVVLFEVCVLLQQISDGAATDMPQLSNSTSIVILASITAVYLSITAACTIVICRIVWKRSKSNRISLRPKASHQSYELTDMRDRRGIADHTDLVPSGRAGVWRKLVDELSLANGTGPSYTGAQHVQPTEPREQHSQPVISKARAEDTEQHPAQSSADRGARPAAPSSLVPMHSSTSKKPELDDVFESVDYEDEGRAKRGCSRGQGGKKKQSPGGTAKSTARESQSPSPSGEAFKKKKVKGRTNSTKPLLEARDSWELSFTESNTNLMDEVMSSLNLPSDAPQHPSSDTPSEGDEARQACGSESSTTPQPVSGSDAGTAPRPAHTSHDVFVTKEMPSSGTNNLPRRSSSGTLSRPRQITSGFGTMPRASHPKLRRSSASSSGPKVLVSPIASTSYRLTSRDKPCGVNRAASVSAIPEHHSLSTKIEVEQNYYTLETRMGGGVGRKVVLCAQQPSTRDTD